MIKRIHKLENIAVVLTAITVPTSGNQVLALRGSAFNNRNNMIDRVRWFSAVSTQPVPKIKNQTPYRRVNGIHSSFPSVDEALSFLSIVGVRSIALALKRCVARNATSAVPHVFGDPRNTLTTPLLTQHGSLFTLWKRRPRRVAFRQTASRTSCFASVFSRTIQTKVGSSCEPPLADTTPLQPSAFTLQVFIRRQPHCGCGDF